jgi:hypothetical protein
MSGRHAMSGEDSGGGVRPFIFSGVELLKVSCGRTDTNIFCFVLI